MVKRRRALAKEERSLIEQRLLSNPALLALLVDAMVDGGTLPESCGGDALGDEDLSFVLDLIKAHLTAARDSAAQLRDRLLEGTQMPVRPLVIERPRRRARAVVRCVASRRMLYKTAERTPSSQRRAHEAVPRPVPRRLARSLVEEVDPTVVVLHLHPPRRQRVGQLLHRVAVRDRAAVMMSSGMSGASGSPPDAVRWWSAGLQSLSRPEACHCSGMESWMLAVDA